jgi:hypothetical protein
MQKTTSSCGPRSGVHRLFLVEQPAGCAGCGLEARAPWLWRAARRLRRMRAGSPRTRLKACAPWQCRAAHLSHRVRDGDPRTLAIQAGCCRIAMRNPSRLGTGMRYVRLLRSRIMTGNSGAPSYRRKTFSSLRRPVIPIYVSAPPIAIIMIKGIRTSHHESITADCGMCGS